MKHLKSFKLFENNNQKIYYHGRDPKKRPYSGNYIYLTDNMGFAISFSDMKELWAFTLNFPESQIFTFSNPKHRELLKQNVDEITFKSILDSSDVEIDWAGFGNLANEDFEYGEDLLESLGFKAVKLRERPNIYSILVFNQNNITLQNKIDLTTPEMQKFAGEWYLNPGFEHPDYYTESILTKIGDLCEVKTNFPEADFWLKINGNEDVVGEPTKKFTTENIGIKVLMTDFIVPDYLYYYFLHLFNQGYFSKIAIGTIKLKHIRVIDIKSMKMLLQ